jgi:hypothetical protein
MAWLAATSTTVEPARLDMARCAGAGIILSSVATRYQLGLTRQAGLVILESLRIVMELDSTEAILSRE